MLVIPRIVLQGGIALGPGEARGQQAPLGDPSTVARNWTALGFQRLHLVDADAARGSSASTLATEEVLRDGICDCDVNAACQSADDVERLLAAGALRVVLGPRALEEIDWLASTADLFPGSVLVSVEIRNRRLAVRTPGRGLPTEVTDLFGDIASIPLGGIVLSLAGDGRPAAPDLALIEDLAESDSFPVLVAGTTHMLSDLRALEHRGVSAVLLGESLYRGELDAWSVALEFSDA